MLAPRGVSVSRDDSAMNDLSEPTHRPRGASLASALLIVAVMAIVAWRISEVTNLSDQRHIQKYMRFAESIAAGHLPSDRLNDVSPLYLVVATAWTKAGFGWTYLLDLQIAALGLAALLVAFTARRFGGWLATLGAAATLLFNRAALLNATEFEPETLILLLSAGALFVLVGPDRDRSRTSVFTGMLLLGVSATARPTVIPAALLIALAILAERPTGSIARARRFAIPMAIGLLVPIVAMAFGLRALTGQSTVMDPGTILYEGMSPKTTGYPFAPPPIVADACSTLELTDPLHVAYREVASVDVGRQLTSEESNRYWLRRSLRFASIYPSTVAMQAVRKLLLALHSYDAWDLSVMVTRTDELPRWPWIPFGCAIAIGGLASLRTEWRRGGVIPLAAFVTGYVFVMVLFYVSARQRNAVIPAIAILAGLGLDAFVDFARRRRRREVGAVAIIVVLTAIALTQSYSWEREDRYYWRAIAESQSLRRSSTEAAARGDVAAALRLNATEETWLVLNDPDVPEVPSGELEAEAMAELDKSQQDANLFDIALALQKAGAWNRSDEILRSLEDVSYHPWRRYATVNSVAYYRARAMLHLGRRDEAAALLDRAAREAPGDSNVLALRALLRPDGNDASRLDAVHDRFTAMLARARAFLDAGRIDDAARLARAASQGFPRWDRARILSEYLDDRIAARNQRSRRP